MVRKEILPGYVVTVIVAVVLMIGMLNLQPVLLNNNMIFEFYPTWLEKMMAGDLFYRFMWLLGDMTEGAFLKSVPGSVLMVIMTFVGYHLEKTNSKYRGTGVGGNSSKFLNMVIAAFVGLIICQIIYSSFFSVGWVPSFTPMCSVAPALILTFGKTPKKTATAAVLAGVVPFPFAYFIMTRITDPTKLPGFVAGAFGMVIGTIISTEICRRLPWMTEPDPVDPNAKPLDPPEAMTGNKLFFNRLFADSNELVFWGSAWGGLGMYLGATISWFMNPMHPSYSSGNFPVMLCAQMVTVATAIFIWYPKYKNEGFAFTFPSLVNTAAIVNTYGTNWQIILPTILVSAIILPPMVDWILKFIKYDGRWHVCCFALSSIAIVCIFWSFFVMEVIMPMLPV